MGGGGGEARGDGMACRFGLFTQPPELFLRHVLDPRPKVPPLDLTVHPSTSSPLPYLFPSINTLEEDHVTMGATLLSLFISIMSSFSCCSSSCLSSHLSQQLFQHRLYP